MDALKQIAVVDSSIHVLRVCMTPRELCEQMLVQVRKSPLACGTRVQRLRHNDALRGIEHLRIFLGGQSAVAVDLTERTLLEFRQSLTSSGLEKAYANDLVRHVRNGINALPKEMLNRQMLDDKAWQQATRFDGLEKKTADLLKDYWLNGRKVRKGVLTLNPVSASYRDKVVRAALILMGKVGKKSLADIVEADGDNFLQEYVHRGMRNTGVEMLVSVNALFRYAIARKLFEANPFSSYSAKTVTTDDDFVAEEGIARLRDLTTCDMNSFMEVRNRLLAYGLCYDFALRIGEAVRLNIQDVALDDLVCLTLRTAVQKGANKRPVVLHNYFKETMALIDRYIQLRKSMNSTNDALLLADDGGRLAEGGARQAIAGHCKELGVLTFERNNPMPHRLRHSFGSLNMQPLGLSLSVWEISERLRHENIKTTTDTYVNRNPLIQRARHEARLRRNDNGKKASRHSDETAGRVYDDFRLTEHEALKVVRPLGITWRSLRQYCLQNGMAKTIDKACFYSEAAIDDISRNWMPKDRAMKLLKLSKSGYYFWVGENAIQTLTIGRAAFVKNEAVLPALDRKSA
jgi:site-specific recombinase XerD